MEPGRVFQAPSTQLMWLEGHIAHGTDGSVRKTRVLRDPASCFDIISPILAKELNLRVEKLPPAFARAANGAKMDVIGSVTTQVTIQDSRGVQEVFYINFIIIDLINLDVILRIP